MSLDPSTLPPNIRRAMEREPDPRARHGVPASAAPASEKAAEPSADDIEPPDAFTGPEKLLHRDFASDMGRRGVHLVHARTDMESTIGLGLPDFHCLYVADDGVCRGCAVEFKKAGGSCSQKQQDCISEMRAKGIPVKVCWTLAAAIHFAKLQLHLP